MTAAALQDIRLPRRCREVLGYGGYRAEAAEHIGDSWRQVIGPDRLPGEVDVPLLMA